jgi:hypothetical protein
MRAIVPLLNGVDHVALLSSKYGAERVIPATIGPIAMNTSQKPKIDVAETHTMAFCSCEVRNRGVGAKPHTSMVAVLPPKRLAHALAPNRHKRLKIETTRNAFTYVFSGSGKIENPAYRLDDRGRLIGWSSIQ